MNDFEIFIHMICKNHHLRYNVSPFVSGVAVAITLHDDNDATLFIFDSKGTFIDITDGRKLYEGL